jgi:hypothetical protein
MLQMSLGVQHHMALAPALKRANLHVAGAGDAGK